MTHPYTQVILSSGEALSAAEVYEGLIALARSQSPFPLLSSGDLARAVIGQAFDALAWRQERDEEDS